MQETQIQSLDWENPMEKEMATHSNIFDSPLGVAKESDMTKQLKSNNNTLFITLTIYSYFSNFEQLALIYPCCDGNGLPRKH